LEYVRNQTDELCEFAVSRNGYALSCVKTQSSRIVEIAVRQNPDAIIHVDKQLLNITFNCSDDQTIDISDAVFNAMHKSSDSECDEYDEYDD